MHIENQTQAIGVISELQKAIWLKNNNRFNRTLFEFSVMESGEIKLDARYGFYLRGNKDNTGKTNFTGKTIEEATQKFIDYFSDGTKGEISRDVNDDQFYASFYYKDTVWVITNSRQQHYSYTDSFDD